MTSEIIKTVLALMTNSESPVAAFQVRTVPSAPPLMMRSSVQQRGVLSRADHSSSSSNPPGMDGGAEGDGAPPPPTPTSSSADEGFGGRAAGAAARKGAMSEAVLAFSPTQTRIRTGGSHELDQTDELLRRKHARHR